MGTSCFSENRPNPNRNSLESTAPQLLSIPSDSHINPETVHETPKRKMEANLSTVGSFAAAS
jgi:hypothetical protein